MAYRNIEDIPETVWTKLRDQRLFFGHQSVGVNILDGLCDLIKKYPQIQLQIVTTKNPSKVEKGVLAHSRIGENRDPVGKIAAFADLMDNGMGNRVDFAFLKLCYVDIRHGTPVEQLFRTYQDTLRTLEKKFSETTFIHVTNPLTVSKITWKTKLKSLLNIGNLWEYNDNIARNRFNRLLRNAYQHQAPLFDIAAFESTSQAGHFTTFRYKHKIYEMLSPSYTEDGGHLNAVGRQHVAEALIVTLANIVE